MSPSNPKPKGRVGRIEYWNTKADKPRPTGPVDPTKSIWTPPLLPASAPSPAELKLLKPHAGLVVDPIRDLAKAEERFAFPTPQSLPADPLPVKGPEPVPGVPEAGPAPNLAGPSIMEPAQAKDQMAAPPLYDPMAPKPGG